MGMIGGGGPLYVPPMVDKMIGDAFPVVKKVADNMEEIFLVGSALKLSNVGAPLLVQRGVLSHGATGLANTTVVIDFDDLDILPENILASHVRVKGNTSGRYYFGESGLFTSYVDNLGLHLTLAAGVPADIQEAIVDWFLIYGG